MNRIIYIGGSGKLATYIEKNTDYIVSKRDKSNPFYLDLNDIDRSKLIQKENCLFIIGAAISEPTKCENNPSLCKMINFLKTAELINKLLLKNKVLFLSSDLVFEGNDINKPNNENTKTNPIHLYSKYKIKIEEKFTDHDNFYIARLSYLLFKENSFTNYLKSCLTKEIMPEIIHPLIRHATGPEEVLRYVDILAKESNNCPKIKHISGKPLSRLEMYFRWCKENNITAEYKMIHISNTKMNNYPNYINFKSIYKL